MIGCLSVSPNLIGFYITHFEAMLLGSYKFTNGEKEVTVAERVEPHNPLWA